MPSKCRAEAAQQVSWNTKSLGSRSALGYGGGTEEPVREGNAEDRTAVRGPRGRSDQVVATRLLLVCAAATLPKPTARGRGRLKRRPGGLRLRIPAALLCRGRRRRAAAGAALLHRHVGKPDGWA